MRAWLACLLVAGCDLDLERMIDQPHFTSYEACEVCPEGTIMMQPPDGTVSRAAELLPDPIAKGRTAAGYVAAIPIARDRALLARGRDRFDIYCAACHGRLGNGISQVAENMKLRPPANLLSPPYDQYPPGRTFAVITEGFGLMRSYANELPVHDRWAVVAYLAALRVSQHATLAELPKSLQEEAQPWLK